MHSNRAKEGRERELDEGAKLRVATMAAAVVWTPIWPGRGSVGSGKGCWRCGVRRGGLGCGESRKGGEFGRHKRQRRPAQARLDPCARKEKGTGTRSIQARERIRATQCEGRGSPARATCGVAGGRRGMGAEHSDEQGINSGVSTNFDPTLTSQNSNFHMGT